MELTRRSTLIYALLAALLALVLAWQLEEHVRVCDAARSDLRNRSKDTAHALGATIRGLQLSGAVFGNRLQPVLDNLVGGRTNELVRSGEFVSVVFLNAAGEPVASAGRPIDLEQSEIQQGMERWGTRAVTFVYPVEGAMVPPEGETNNPAAPVLLPPFTNSVREGRPPRRPPEDRPGASNLVSNAEGTNNSTTVAERPPRPQGPDPRPRRPFWARRMNLGEK